MRVNFVLPTLNPSGGVKVVREYCQWLNDEGHDCLIYYPMTEKLKHCFSKNYNDEYTVPYIRPGGIRDADITIATAWNTAKIVLDLPPICGKKAYFIQHYERLWDYRADYTYDYPLHQIVVSHWLYQILHLFHNTQPYIVENGIRLPSGVYKDSTKRPLTILMPYRDEEWKGTRFGLKAFEGIREKHPECAFQVYGWDIGDDVPDWVAKYENLPDASVHELMYRADIFLNPTTIEGFGLPSLEAMARMCAVVTTNVGAVPEYTDHGFYAFLAEPYDVTRMVSCVNMLIEDDRLRLAMQKLGYEASKNWSFDKSAKRFEQCLISLVQS
jgi:hypothetical protein